MTPKAPLARGIGRSLRLYYGDPARARRMDALNAQFASRGALVFDVGAHVGDRVASFRRLGCRVVAVEPQAAALRAMKLIFRGDPDVTLLRLALGREPGLTDLHINTDNPTVSTASAAFMTAASDTPGWREQSWDRISRVPIATLQDVIDQHGAPDFVKIDVEGYEAEVLAGLGVPVPALSFEFTRVGLDVAFRSLERLAAIGPYECNLSLGERHELDLSRWVSPEELRGLLGTSHAETNSGDVYARLRS